MSDNYDPLATQTSSITFRRLDAFQDSAAAFGKTAAGAPVALLVATDGTIQTRRLARATDEVLLIGTDPLSVARPLLVDNLGRLALRPLSPHPALDPDGLRIFLLGPGDAQTQAKGDADGTVHVNDPTARNTLASVLAAIQAPQPRSITNLPADYPDALAEARLLSILGQLDVSMSSVRDAITGASPQAQTLWGLGQSIVTTIQGTHPRQVTNFPADYPDALTQARLQAIQSQLDRAASEVWDVRSAQGAVTAPANANGLTLALDLGITGRTHVQRFISASAGAVVSVQVSRDGVTWRTIETLTFPASPGGLAAFPGNGYRHVRITSPTPAVAMEFEITASR